MRHFDNEIENHFEKLKSVADMMKMELERIGFDDDNRHYYKIKPKNGIEFLIMREKTGKFEITLQPPEIKFKCQNNRNNQIYTSYLINNGEHMTKSINVSQNKTAEKIAFEIDRRLFESWDKLSKRYIKLRHRELKRDKRQIETTNNFKSKGFHFIQHSVQKAYIKNLSVDFSSDWKKVDSLTIKGISKKTVFDIIDFLNGGKK